MALAGVTACTRQPAEKIVPFVRQPEELVPGRPLFYSTAMSLGGVATGLLVESHEGRPTKIEGNALHPGSLGASDIFAQAAVLGLYDPDRSQTLTNLGEIRPWSAFLGTIRAALAAQQPLQGAGLRILTESVSSPTLAAQIRGLLARFPFRPMAPVGSGQPRERPRRREARVRRIRRGPVPLRSRRRHPLARRRFPRRRPRRPALRARLQRPAAARNRRPDESALRAREHADRHRLPRRPSAPDQAERDRGGRPCDRRGVRRAGAASRSARTGAWTRRSRNGSRRWRRICWRIAASSLVVAGDGLPAPVHALAHAMNEALGNVGRTVDLHRSGRGRTGRSDSIAARPRRRHDGRHGRRARDCRRQSRSTPRRPTSRSRRRWAGSRSACTSASTTMRRRRCAIGKSRKRTFSKRGATRRGYDGTVSIVQPLIAPLYNGKSAHELLAAMSDRPERSGYDIVREFWSRGGSLAVPDTVRLPTPGTGRAPRGGHGQPGRVAIAGGVRRRAGPEPRRPSPRSSRQRGAAGCTTA